MRIVTIMVLTGVLLAGGLFLACSSSPEVKDSLSTEGRADLDEVPMTRSGTTSSKTNVKVKTCPRCGQQNNTGKRCSFCDKKL
ncbi:MAG TPA: hypothetical protein PLD82_08510 [Spirochaetota bacterium]|nr:hypothetical protein [Spirochaetota bacterium]